MKQKPERDVDILDGGSIVVFRARTAQARSWIAENVSNEGYQPSWPHIVYCERRYADELADGMADDGLTVSAA